MNSIKLGVLALTILSGIGGAFASTFKAKRAGTLYYGTQVATGVIKWKKAATGSCSTGGSLACTITSNVPSATVTALTNTFPATYAIKNSSGGKRRI